jgi:hypothetical protein
VRDRTVEQMFLAIYSMPVLQAVVGIRASDESPRRQPGLEPEHMAFILERIGEIKAQIAEGGLREAVIRSGVYIGMGGPDVDERAFNQLRRVRAERGRDSKHAIGRQSPKRRAGGDPCRRLGGRRSHR